MSDILVTGGNGILGRKVVARLARDGHDVRVMSRRPEPPEWELKSHPGATWARADMTTGAGIWEAVRGIQTIIHAASSPFVNTRQVDVDGTVQLLRAAGAAGVSHVVYISIVGIDRIPFGYYQAKLAAEAAVQAGEVPWTILRATQFHDFLDRILGSIAWSPVCFLPTDFRFQLVDSGEVAEVLVAAAAAPPAGRLPDMGGPQVLTSREIAHAWFIARHKRRLVLPLPLVGATAAAFRQGLNTCPEQRQGRVTWEEWLAARAADQVS